MSTAAPERPNARGRFGPYGGRYAPEILIPALDELAAAWQALRDDPTFRGELGGLLAELRPGRAVDRAGHRDRNADSDGGAACR